MHFCAVVVLYITFMFDRKFKKKKWYFMESDVCICQRLCICQYFKRHSKCNTENDSSNAVQRMTLQMLYVCISIYIHTLLSVYMSKTMHMYKNIYTCTQSYV